MEFGNPPVPAEPGDAQRWQETRRRRRLLEGLWGVDLEQRLMLHFGQVRRAIVGPKSKSRNLYRRLTTELAVLYRDPPRVWHRQLGETPEFLGPDGLLAAAGLWPLMRRFQSGVLGMREQFLRVDWDPRRRLPAFRVVTPDVVCAESFDLDPGTPVEVRELRWRVVGGRGLWTWECLSIADLDAPTYRIVSCGQDGADLTEQVLGRPASGPWYPYRYTQGPRRGEPFLPYVLYHADVHGCLFDPYAWTELADAALDVAVAWTWWGHLLFKASWPQRWGIDVYVEGTVAEDTAQGRRSEVPADATSLIHLAARAGATNPQVGQWSPSADVKTVAESIGMFEAGCSDIAGIDAAHIMRESADAWSGAALSISRDGKREAQSVYEPAFQPRDLELLEKTAAIVNLAQVLSAPLPEAGYRIAYTRIPLSADELERRRRHHTEMIAANRMSRTEAYMQEHPGITEAEARTALEKIAAENAKYEEGAEAAEAEETTEDPNTEEA